MTNCEFNVELFSANKAENYLTLIAPLRRRKSSFTMLFLLLLLPSILLWIEILRLNGEWGEDGLAIILRDPAQTELFTISRFL